ncbi:MAG: hypothetical protein HC803_09050 [Saprospiraceae bacterium]|nr:hypothetical protein [Saprospiraceae bacterium]
MNIEGKLQILVDEKSTGNLFYYTENTFFSDDYSAYLVFNRPGKGQLYISRGANVYAIYEKTVSK